MDEFSLVTSELGDSDKSTRSLEELSLISDDEDFPLLSSDSSEIEELHSSHKEEENDVLQSNETRTRALSEDLKDHSDPSTSCTNQASRNPDLGPIKVRRKRQSSGSKADCVSPKTKANVIDSEDGSCSSSSSSVPDNNKRQRKTNNKGIVSIFR